jgi:hypothetical protein
MILTGYYFLSRSHDLMMVACIVLAEAVLIGVWGFPNFPEGLNGIYFSLCIVVLFLSHFFTSVLASWIPSFAHIWSASKEAYDRVRSAGKKAWGYVSGIRREV